MKAGWAFVALPLVPSHIVGGEVWRILQAGGEVWVTPASGRRDVDDPTSGMRDVSKTSHTAGGEVVDGFPHEGMENCE